jgi:hypothetical protein
LPRINNKDSLSWDVLKDFPDVVIDGFGNLGDIDSNIGSFDSHWPSGLPESSYWTGTVNAGEQGYSWIIYDRRNYVSLGNARGKVLHVLCVPHGDDAADAAFPDYATSPPALLGSWLLVNVENVPQEIIERYMYLYSEDTYAHHKAFEFIGEFEFLANGTVIFRDAELWHVGVMPEAVSGTWKIHNKQLILSVAGREAVVDYDLSDSTLTVFYSGTDYHAVYARPEYWEQASRAKQMREAGILAISEIAMTRADAQAWCQRQGGRLPFINNSASLAWDEAKNASEITIDGFSNLDSGNFGPRNPSAPWANTVRFEYSAWQHLLPSDGFRLYYWTGTTFSDEPDKTWIICEHIGVFMAHRSHDDESFVFCVP